MVIDNTNDWPHEFYVLPDGTGIFKADARPCGVCGKDDFLLVQTAMGQRVQCPCVKVKRGERVLGTLNRERWILRRIEK